MSTPLIFLLSIFYFLFSNIAIAERIESDSFIVPSDTVTPGNFSSSDSFRMFGNITQISTGRSTSDSFDLSAGFLAFPEAEAEAAATVAAEAATPSTSSEGILISILRSLVPPRPVVGVPITKACGVADLNCDGKVDIKDLGAFLYFTPRLGPNPADFNKDGVINSKDLSRLFSAWTERFLVFLPDKISPISEKKEQFDFEKPKDSLRKKESGVAEVSKSISRDVIISKGKQGFSIIFDSIKSFVEKIRKVVKSIF